MAFDRASLLTDVRRGAMFPNSASTGTEDSDITAHANIELRTRIETLMMSYAEEFLIRRKVVSQPAGYDVVRMPSRAALGKVRDVVWIDSSGNEYSLERVRPDIKAITGYRGNGQPCGFWIEANTIRLYPSPQAAGTVRFRYVRRLPSIVSSSGSTQTNAATISGTNLTLYVNATTSSSSLYDVYWSTDPFELLAQDCTSNGGYELTASDGNWDLLTSEQLYEGANVYLSGEAYQIPIPTEYYDLLVQRTICRLLRAHGDTQSLAVAEGDAAEMEAAIVSAFGSRVDGSPRHVSGGLQRNFARGPWLYGR